MAFEAVIRFEVEDAKSLCFSTFRAANLPDADVEVLEGNFSGFARNRSAVLFNNHRCMRS